MILATDPNDPTRQTSRVSLARLIGLMEKVKNEDELRAWIFDRVLAKKYNIYWQLPRGMFAFSWMGEEAWIGEKSQTMQLRPHTDSEMWQERPEVRFVRLDKELAEKFRNNERIRVLSFLDGLFIPNDVAANTGLLEATDFSGRLRVSHASHPAPHAQIDSVYKSPELFEDVNAIHPDQDFAKVYFIDLYVEDSIREDIRNNFNDSPSQEITPYMRALDQKPGYNSGKHRYTDYLACDTNAVVQPESASINPEKEPIEDGDPYELKGHCDSVYMLYLTTERCSRNPAFVGASKPDERKKIAHETFDQLLNEMMKGDGDQCARKSKLSDLFKQTRLNYALRLIDPEYDHNRGRPEEDRGEWPPELGKEFLAQPDTLRRQFVTPVLALIIGGAKHWQQLATPSAGSPTKQQALQQWLEDHGLTGTDELKTAFALIAWYGANSKNIPIPPKFAKPSTSRDQAAGARRASHRRA